VNHKLRAIDLYSGVGGWSLGLRMAGVDVVASYEIWSHAHATNSQNNGHESSVTDIRALRLSDLPANIDIVVGSPPCTQFSFSNRGGSGDIDDGLVDVTKFLAVVDRLKPKFWAMENVPRLAAIMQKELAKGGRLCRFQHLRPQIHVVDSCEWGVPQRRKRCIVGDLPFALLLNYRSLAKRRTLGDVVKSVNGPRPSDPVYDITLHRSDLIDHDPEQVLSPEEERINREMKTFHPVYNNMAFPDSLKRPSRTVTATCTRVSRESIVIAAPEAKGRFRRLTVRERACLQSFPINYQFYGETYAQKLKMVGNAVPPLLTFYIASAMLNTPTSKIASPSVAISRFKAPESRPLATKPDRVGESYPANRRFRAAIPHLRFKSGVRFEFGNSFRGAQASWGVRFFFGSSKNIQQVELGNPLVEGLAGVGGALQHIAASRHMTKALQRLINETSSSRLQGVWSHRVVHHVSPFDIVDAIGESVQKLISRRGFGSVADVAIASMLKDRSNPHGWEKVLRNADCVFAGILIGSLVNELFSAERIVEKLDGQQRRLAFAGDAN
jgi:DNA (cytosine-5)-methyltransferase 1